MTPSEKFTQKVQKSSTETLIELYRNMRAAWGSANEFPPKSLYIVWDEIEERIGEEAINAIDWKS